MTNPNRAQRRAMQKNPGSSIGANIAEAFKKAAQEQRIGQESEEDKQIPEDLNILPLPIKQEVITGETYGYIQWTWEPVGLDIRVIGILYTQDSSWDDPDIGKRAQGYYEVQLSMPEEKSVFSFDRLIAKAIGQAMISAWNWKDIWKQHAGHFMEKELFGYGTESDELDRG